MKVFQPVAAPETRQFVERSWGRLFGTTTSNQLLLRVFVDFTVANAVLVIFSIAVTSLAAEGVIRVLDGSPLFAADLPETIDRDLGEKYVDAIPVLQAYRAAGFPKIRRPCPIDTSHRRNGSASCTN